jgi:hypothetical protein
MFIFPATLVGAAAVAVFRDEAMALPDHAVEVCNVEPAVMMVNLRTGVDAVRPRMAEVLEARPKTRFDWITSLPNLGRAVEYVAGTVTAPPAIVSRAEIDAKYAELQGYRVPALFVAKALAADLFKLLPSDQVTAIEEGSGIYNHAQDGIALASLFRAHAAALKDKHPFTDAQLDALESIGLWLSENVTPTGARQRKRDASEQAALRDRLWTLLRVRHAELRKVGNELFGEDDLDARVPRLGSRVASATAKAENDNESATPPQPPTG